MPAAGHRWLEDVAIADAAFEAWAPSAEELLVEAGEAVLETMAGAAGRVQRIVQRAVTLEDSPDLLLVRLLEALLWHKDAEQLLLHVGPLTLAVAAGGGEAGGSAEEPAGREAGAVGVAARSADRWAVRAELWGERIDPSRHDGVDVKAVTLHGLAVSRGRDGSWRARVVLDV